MTIHYMRSGVCGLTLPGFITPTRLSHEEEDISLHILANDRNDEQPYRFRQLRHERPISTASSRSSTASKSTPPRSLSTILEEKAKSLLAQLSHNKAPPSQYTHWQDDKRMSRTLNYIRYGNQSPDYVPIETVPEPTTIPRTNRNSTVRTSVYSSHCLVSGTATRRSSRYFQM